MTLPEDLKESIDNLIEDYGYQTMLESIETLKSKLGELRKSELDVAANIANKNLVTTSLDVGVSSELVDIGHESYIYDNKIELGGSPIKYIVPIAFSKKADAIHFSDLMTGKH